MKKEEKFLLVENLTKKFSENNNTKSPKFFRYINEVPTILLIAIIFIVIFKPI